MLLSWSVTTDHARDVDEKWVVVRITMISLFVRASKEPKACVVAISLIQPLFNSFNKF
jgi:hypothetical protein